MLLDIYDFMKKRQMGGFFDCELFSKDKAHKKIQFSVALIDIYSFVRDLVFFLHT